MSRSSRMNVKTVDIFRVHRCRVRRWSFRPSERKLASALSSLASSLAPSKDAIGARLLVAEGVLANNDARKGRGEDFFFDLRSGKTTRRI